MNKFWRIEEGSTELHRSLEEIAAEEHFAATFRRTPEGRYVVALPFRKNLDQLGESHARALKRFRSLDIKLASNPELKKQYTAVIQEYLDLGHMSLDKDIKLPGFYVPHHAVFKETSQTTKVRIVFDGSAKTNTGISLNDTLMVGPRIQDDIISLILGFRLYNYVLTGDIEKMYRQFLVRPQDRRFQRILWRNESGGISTYQLNTVTFGLSAAPFLATRCLQQLADDEAHSFPTASGVLKRDLYVDDLIAGTQTWDEAVQLRDEIIQLLQRGGIHIRQWASNEKSLLRGLPSSSVNLSLQSDADETLKPLEVVWNSGTDAIVHSVTPIPVGDRITKRTILSVIARIFDPLGLLGPVIVTAKILLQSLWLLKLNWDESVPTTIHTTWTTFCAELHLLKMHSVDIQVHGFCDASERAYGACIYVRTSIKDQVRCALLCAKSRVAPVKVVSLPRLELCGALLLAKLYRSVIHATNLNANQTVFWTDSTITLHWINTQPVFLKTFVANRVAEIGEKTNIANWRHIPSEDNPTNVLSRGQSPGEFVRNQMWQSGPSWVVLDEAAWPHLEVSRSDEIPEIREHACLVTDIAPNELVHRYSDFNRLIRIFVFCLRFRNPDKNRGFLQLDELRNAHDRVVGLVQGECFQQEFRDLQVNGGVNPKSRLASLNPFLDSFNLIRVGGRLRLSNISYNQRHPIVLPRSHHFISMIIRQCHVRNLHTGVLATLHNIRQRYWVLNGRNQVRRIIRQCVRCFRNNPPVSNCIMGDLPITRVTESRPFSTVGVDYCGPFFIKEKKFRNRQRVKVYVAVFVCFAVEAVHLEVVSDMTTDGFLAALRRFIARRGKCSHIFSDNGSNFIGARNELRELYDLWSSEAHLESLDHFTSEEGITWTFIPPLSPNFGGLWESAVKSMKHHLKRVVGQELFTFEEFNTFIIQIEAVLNSRPLTALSADPNDLSALSPGHFLIGQSFTDLPESDFRDVPKNRLSMWQHIQKVRCDFWARWHKEYLNELTVRHKWTHGTHAIREGTLVLLREDNLPPLQWKLGRVMQTQLGQDGTIRTVTVKTSTSTLVRNVRKLSPLPLDGKA